MSRYALVLAFAVLAGLGSALGYRELVAYGIPFGPVVTALAWIALWIGCAARSRPCPFAAAVSWYELAPAVIASVFMQLLLDMRMRWLGDVIVGALHVIALIVLLAIARCNRRSSRT